MILCFTSLDPSLDILSILLTFIFLFSSKVELTFKQRAIFKSKTDKNMMKKVHLGTLH